MSEILAPRCVYLGVRDVNANLERLQDLGLGVEIVFNTTTDLWPKVKWDTLLGLADDLNELNIPVSCHGPFHNFAVAGNDAHIAEYSFQALSAGIEAARILGSPLMVFHTGYIPQIPAHKRDKWMDVFCGKLGQLLETAADNRIVLAMENTYEPDTSLFEEIFARIQHPFLGMCLDTGHAACFGKVPVVQWVERFSEQIVHLHISDNDGISDLHWPPGKGVVSLSTLLGPLLARGARPSVTFEVELDEAKASNDYLNRVLAAALPAGHD